MFTPAPRVQVPSVAAKGEVFSVKTLISHPMETGLRHDDQGNVIPRKIINKFTCRYKDVMVFSVDFHEAVAANPSSNSTCARRRAVASNLSGKRTAEPSSCFSITSPSVDHEASDARGACSR